MFYKNKKHNLFPIRGRPTQGDIDDCLFSYFP